MIEDILKYSLYLTSIAIVILTAILALIQAKKNPKKKLVKRYIIAICVIGVITFPLQCKKDSLADDKIQQKEIDFNKRLDFKTDSIKNLQETNIDSTNEVLIRQNAIIIKQNKGLLISQDILGYSKASGLATIEFYEKENYLGIQIINREKYPLENLNIMLIDPDEYNLCISKKKKKVIYLKSDCIAKYSHLLKQELNLNKKPSAYFINDFAFSKPNINEYKYYIFRINQKDFITMQYVILYTDKTNKTKYSYKIFKYNDGIYNFMDDYNTQEFSKEQWKQNPLYLKDMIFDYN